MGVSHPDFARRTLAALLSSLLVLGPGASALAAPGKATLVVLPEVTLPGASDAFAAKVLSQIQNELHQRTELKLVDAPSNRAGQDTRAKDKAGAEKARSAALQLLDKAGDLSLRGKAKQAAQSLQKGVAQLSAAPLALDEAGGKLLGDMLLQLAVTRSMAGDEEGSDQALNELVRRSPERTLAAGSFPPAFIRSFEAARQRGLSGARASIRVFAPAGISGARVLLDGRPLGNAPILLADALAGQHAIRVESGEQAWADSVKADAGAQLSVLPQLGDSSSENSAAGSLAQGNIDRATATRLARLAKAAGAQAVLVGTVSREGDGYTVRSALVFVRGEKAVPLATLALDAEMLSGSLEVLRLADDLVTKLTNPPPGALLPLAMGGSATEAEMPSVVAAPAAAETALALPAASDLAAAAGTEKKPVPAPEKSPELALPLPIETPAIAAEPPPAQASAVLPAPVPEPAPAEPASRMPVIPGAPPPAPAPVAAAPVAVVPVAPAPIPVAPAPVATAPIAPPPAPVAVERTPVIPGATASDRVPVIPNATANDRVPVIPGASTTAAPAPATAPKPPPLAGSLDAATAGLNNPSATPPAETPAPATDAQLATAAPKPIVEPAPSKNLFVPRKPTDRDDDDQQVAVATTATPPAPTASIQIEAREANEIATVKEQPAKKNHTVLWIVAGALVVGAAAVGGIVLYANSRTASSSDVSLSWSH